MTSGSDPAEEAVFGQSGRSSASVVDDVVAAARGMSRPAYRGQACSSWPLQSGAIRRICKTYGHDVLTDLDELRHLHSEYHRERLLGPLPRMAVPATGGLPSTDLQRLALLQHLGAATGLIDFTEDPLVALWFACREAARSDGKIFVVDLANQSFLNLNPNKHYSAESLFSLTQHQASYWHPNLDGLSMTRVIGQRSVFLLGTPLIPGGLWVEVEVPSFAKSDLLSHLGDLGKSDATLFMDVFGHATSNNSSLGISPPLRPRATAVNLKRDGNKAMADGRTDDAIRAYTAYVELHPDVAEPYLLRASALAAKGRHGDAIHDYDAAVQRIHNPTPQGLISPMLRTQYLSAVYYNRANSNAAMNEHAEAIADYEHARESSPAELMGVADILYNQANSYFDLGMFHEAADAYREAEENGATRDATSLGYGNCMLALSRLADAEDAYRRVSAPLSELNLQSLTVIRHAAGESDFEAEWRGGMLYLAIADPADSGALGQQSVVLLRPDANTGNRGVAGPGGRGYPGKPPIVVAFATK